MRSLKRLINQIQEAITRFESHLTVNTQERSTPPN